MFASPACLNYQPELFHHRRMPNADRRTRPFARDLHALIDELLPAEIKQVFRAKRIRDACEP